MEPIAHIHCTSAFVLNHFVLAGLQFAGVHDSFWTHAQNVPVMNRILREQFIKLYSQPLLEELRDSFIEQYPTAEIPPLPSKGNLDLHSLLDATYFFS